LPGAFSAIIFTQCKDWLNWVNQPQSEAELAALHKCIARGAP
jgi:hypothetical protein